MRWTTALLAFSIFSAAAGLSSDSTGGRRQGNDLRGNTPRSLSSVATTTATEDTIARKRKAPGAPLVDSTLLRFVSAQKKQQEERLREIRENDIQLASASSETSSSINNGEVISSNQNNVNGNNSISPDTAENDNTIMSTYRGDDQSDPWLGQFNRNRVAQKLISLGATEEEALKAGEKLQSHVLIRTARRRIRMFLRERDSLWNSNNGVSDQLIENKITLPPGDTMKSPNYGFDDVLDVLVENGFSGKDICAILTHTPSLVMMMPRKSFALESSENSQNLNGTSIVTTDSESSSSSSSGETVEDTIARAFHGLLLSTLGMRRYDARKVIRTCPGLLSVRGSKSAVQVVAMMTQLGVATNAIAREKALIPTLLSRSPAGLFRLISFLSGDGVRMPIKAIGPMIRRTISEELLDAVAPVPTVQRLSGSEMANDDGSIDPELESAIWGKTREERTRKINQVYKNMTETAWTLRNEIGTKDLSRVVAAYPSVLLLDAKTKILPTAAYLMNELGILKGDLPKVLQLYPVLLGKEIEEFEEIVSYLLSLGVKEEDLGSIFRAFPALLTMNIEETMAPVVEYLQSIGITDLGPFITSLPPILGYSVENELKPKWEYLNKVCLQAKFELIKFPAYFSYPFDRVIKTRYDYLAAKEIPRQLLRVDAVLRHGDVEFATKIARDVDGGKVFRVFSENRRRALAGPPKRRRNRAPKGQQQQQIDS